MAESNCANFSVIKILLAEDHSLTRLGLKAALRRTTDIMVIAEAVNGEEAIEKARIFSPDVILMDVAMPLMDGIQAAAAIISKDATSKIIMLSQYDDEDDIMASLAAGASGYCLKDAAPHQLYAAIRCVHGGDVWLDRFIAELVLKLHGTVHSSVNDRPAPMSIRTVNNKQSTESFSAKKLLESNVFKLLKKAKDLNVQSAIRSKKH